MTALPVAPALPRRTLRVGVSGHRDLGPGDHQPLRKAVADVLRRVRLALAEVTDAPGMDVEALPRTVLLSPLAAGADQLVAEEALKQGYELAVPLPYEEESYVRELSAPTAEQTAAAREGYRRLRAHATSVFEVDTAPAGDTAVQERDEAYQAVGRLLLENSDVLLALWNGGEAAGPGGTAQVVKEAEEAGLPVVVIPPSDPQRADLRVCDEAGEHCLRGLDSLAMVVRSLVGPWDLRTATGSAEDLAFARAQRAAYEVFVAEPGPERWSPVARASSALLRGLWRGFMWCFSSRAQQERTPPTPTANPAGPAAPRDGMLTDLGAWASHLADHYVPLYRGAFLLNYLLGALAVTSAVLSLASAAGRCPPELAGTLEGATPWVELSCLLLIALVYWRSRAGHWHAKAIDYRILAELMRHSRELAPLGLAVPSTRPRAHMGGEVDLTLTWVVSHYRALLRDVGLPSGRLTTPVLAERRDHLAGSWIRGQVEYHERTAERLMRAEHVLDGAALAAFGGALVACLLHVLHVGGDAAGLWLTVVAAGLPAWAAAFHGIVSQGEFERLAKRSDSMARRLTDAGNRLEVAAVTWRGLVKQARNASRAMVEELDDWQALSRAGDVPAP